MEIRERAVEALGVTGDKRLVGRLVAMLPDPKLRYAAILALGGLKAVEAIPALLPYIHDRNEPTRSVAVKTVDELQILQRTARRKTPKKSVS